MKYSGKNLSVSSTDNINREESEDINKPSGAYESMQFLNEIRSYPEKDIPQDKYIKAFEYTRDHVSDFNTVTDAAATWQSMGPNNIGGRSLSLAVNPIDTSIIYIGSSSGGLWKSTSGGIGAAAWTQINTGYPSLAVSSIAINKNNVNEIYIGTGENYGYQSSFNGLDNRLTRGMYGIGILKTTDGGSTWIKSLDWSYNNQRGVWKVQYNPFNSNILYAATSEGIYKFNGSAWVKSLDVKMVMDLEVNPLDSNVIYASVGNLTNIAPLTDIGIYKTTNGGTNWTKLSGGLPASWTGKTTIEVYKADPNIITASVSNDLSYIGYYKSTNAGLNWIVLSTAVPIGNQGWYNNANMIKSDNANLILAGTLNIEKSTNGGTSFTTKSDWSLWNTGATPPGQPEGPANFVHADVHEIVSNPKDANKVYIMADGGLYRSNDFGETFYSCNGGYVTSQFYAALSNSYQDSVWCLGGMQDNRAAFHQGTTAWYKTFSGDGMSAGVNASNDNICYMEYTYGDLNKSTNRGVSWTDISPPNAGTSSAYCFVAPYIIAKSNSNIVYIGGTSIYKSTTGGGNWQGPYGASVFGGNRLLSMAVSYTNPDTLYTGSAPSATTAGVFRSVNGGVNWTSITGTLPNRYVTDLAINPNNSKEVIATFGGFGTGHVFRTTNNGDTWTNISGNLPDIPHQSAVIDPLFPQNIYVGNDFGTYVTTNNGAVWYEYRTGMPYAMIFDLSISYTNRKLRAATYGNGIWQRDLVQNPVSVGNSNTIVKDFKLYQNYPNPFNPATKIKFDLNKPAFVDLKVYDVKGMEIKNIYSRYDGAGNHEAEFNASALSSGIYFYSIFINGVKTDSKKMLLLK
ncbi:MAG: T9SS type A sorting domain-containing protein [Ignavibacteria bacterium]|nr:T9SS type A sorting domain-containing protein [Ignavibacteria bacterium]